MNIKEQNQAVFYSIEGSFIKRFLIIDIVMGSGIFYAVKIISTSVLIGMAASVMGTEGMKRIPKWWKDAVK